MIDTCITQLLARDVILHDVFCTNRLR